MSFRNFLILTVILYTFPQQGFSAAPGTLTPSVAVKPAYSSVTDLYIGSKVEFTLTVGFPAGTTAGVVVEILPSTNVTVMAVGDVNMTRGSNLDIDPNMKMVYHPTEDSKDTAFKIYTRGVYNFSNVYNSETSGTDAENNLVINYEAFVVSLDGISDGATHWVSAGIEYNNSYNVWIGQVSYIMRSATNPPVSKTPVYNLTYPSSATTLNKGETLKVVFETWMPYPSPDIAAEAINLHSDTTNNDVKVVSLHVKSIGRNIDGTTEAPQVNLEKMTSSAVLCNSSWAGSRRVRLVLPTTLTNKESRSASPANSTVDDRIEFEAVILMTDDAVEGDEYPIGFGIEVDTAEVWVSYFNLTAGPASGSQPSMSMAIAGVNSTACVSAVTDFVVNITTVETGITVFSLTVEVVESTALPAGVMVAHMEVIESGQNILCSETNLTKESTTSNTVVENSATMTFNISNFGTMSHIGGNNTITVKVYLVPLPGFVSTGQKHKINVGLSGHTTVNDNTNELDIVCEYPPDAPVDFSFNFFHNCTKNCLTRGSVFEFFLDISTERNKNPGQVNVELAVPTNDSESFFVICGYDIQKIGSNLKCINNATIMEATNTTVLSDGTYSKVNVIFPVMCNLGIVNDTEEDKVQIRLTIKIRNDTSVNSSRDEWFGLGSRYSTTQVWVGQYKICIRAPDYYADLAKIHGVAIDSSDLSGTVFPGVRGIEYSFDGVDFKDKPVTFTPDGANASVYNIDKPFITSYVGMTNLPNESCKQSCYVNHEMVVTKLDGYIDIFNDESGTLKSKIPYALDGDNSTCFDLPVQGETPPLFWTRMNTSVILGINASQFDIIISGEGISCARHSNNRVLQVTTPASLQVSYPESSSVGKFHGNIQFCNLTADNAVPNSFSTCGFRCSCPDAPHCEEVIVFLANNENGATWKLCEISATNY
ncbi:uncharacterized protein LOC133195556 isoform X1 [Saccostrea echinata]|uniref:uncharacterized protein LOC133195556 isoform X1 n=1 Tax=Saccostrea echinata TaxID=191078 RepID=UPI002A813B86|nr:uncharacterized protein LOC133195556 isoform X1 [Saccostrea echinata]